MNLQTIRLGWKAPLNPLKGDILELCEPLKPAVYAETHVPGLRSPFKRLDVIHLRWDEEAGSQGYGDWPSST